MRKELNKQDEIKKRRNLEVRKTKRNMGIRVGGWEKKKNNGEQKDNLDIVTNLKLKKIQGYIRLIVNIHIQFYS